MSLLSGPKERLARYPLEVAIVRAMLAHLDAHGWRVAKIYDGDEDPTARPRCATTDEVVASVFAVDECHLFFQNARGQERWVFLVRGNGVDIIADWSYAAIDEFWRCLETFLDMTETIAARLHGKVA